MTPTKAEINRIMRIIGRRGGKKRAAALTPERRKEIAAMGGRARKGTTNAPKK